ncbi:hypothetical protein [Streptomyces sp. 6N223]|uniref:hypothetical protein n=1 Tax=Streptomyces sp. 6N223 TaxID=3457412 RepID=UPI003FD5B2C7
MNPMTPRPLRELTETRRRVMTTQELREHGVSTAAAARRCRPGGDWQMPLPGVFLLHPGPPTPEEMLHAVLSYTGGKPGEAMVSGLAGLALHGFTAVPPLAALNRVDVLVPRTRRLRSCGCARIVRTHRLPRAVTREGFPVAPAPRALADAVVRLADPLAVRRLMSEAVRGGHTEPHAVVSEFTRARLMARPQVAGAIETLMSEGRAIAEGRLMELVRLGGLPDPCWNVELWLPGGPSLGAVDAYWPDHAVAVRIEARVPRQPTGPGNDTSTDAFSEDRLRQASMERLGIALVHLTPRKLREAVEQQITAVRDALLQAATRDPAGYVVVLPR